jgi:hypothetical protein
MCDGLDRVFGGEGDKLLPPNRMRDQNKNMDRCPYLQRYMNEKGGNPVQRSHGVRQIAFLVLFSFSFSPFIVFSLKAQPSQSQAQTPLEITKIDLFERSGWESTQVSFHRFMLGMARKEAANTAQTEDLILDDDLGHACLKENICNVLNDGKYIGVILVFNAEDVVEKFIIEAYRRNSSREERSVWLSEMFSGNTRRLAADYSDNSRIRILGHADIYEVTMPEDTSVWRRLVLRSRKVAIQLTYRYSRPGLLVRAALTDGTLYAVPADAKPEFLTFEFVRPQTASK